MKDAFVEVGRVKKTDTIDIVVQRSENGDRVDIREFIHSPMYDGYTKSGLRFPTFMTDEVIELLKKAQQP